MGLKAIFFDIDDTLYSTTEFAEKARRDALRAMLNLGLKGEEEELYQELLEVIEEFSPNFGHHFDKLLDRLPAESTAGLSRPLLIAAAVIAYHRRKFRELHLFPDARHLLEKLKGTQLIVGVITSGLAIKQAEKILRLGLTEYLSGQRAIFISDEIGINKPNPKLYQRALATFRLQPEEAMYVGDNPRKDVHPCLELGMWTVWVRKGGKHSNPTYPVQSPHYTIENFGELEAILQKDFAISLL